VVMESYMPHICDMPSKSSNINITKRSTSMTEKERLREEVQKIIDLQIHDQEIASYLIELFLDSPSVSIDEARETADLVLKDNVPNISQLKRFELLDSLVGKVAQFTSKQLKEEEEADSYDDSDLETLETKEEDGWCRLCGTNNRITIHHLIPKLILKRMRNDYAIQSKNFCISTSILSLQRASSIPNSKRVFEVTAFNSLRPITDSWERQ